MSINAQFGEKIFKNELENAIKCTNSENENPESAGMPMEDWTKRDKLRVRQSARNEGLFCTDVGTDSEIGRCNRQDRCGRIKRQDGRKKTDG